MRFLMLYKPDKTKDRSQHIPRAMAKMAEMSSSGKLLSAAGIADRTRGAARIVFDGDFKRESPPSGSSVLFDSDGFALIQAADLQEAIDLAAEFTEAAGEGVLELVQLVDGPPKGQ